MWIPFDQLPSHARVWIYQASNELSADQQQLIQAYIKNEVDGWGTHGTALRASAQILENRFVVIAVDESYQAPSGCSVDKSVRWLKNLGQSLQVDFFDRSIVFIGGQGVETVALNNLKKAVEEERITPGTLVFDNTVSNKGMLEQSWQTTAAQSWIKRYFRVDKVENG